MKKRSRLFVVILIILCAALAVTGGVYLYKEHEYAVSADYYSGLRMGS